MKVKEEWKRWLKTQHSKMKIMASGPITSWQIDGETMETVTDFIFLGSKITADGDCSHEIKTLAPWKKSFDKPRQHIKKQRHYFADKGSYSWSYDFSISHPVMYGCESWTMKRAECWIDAFELWCWRRLLRVPWTARASQPILKEINPEYSLEALMLKLKLQYFGHLMRRADSLKKTLMLKKSEGRRRGQENEMVGWNHWTQWTWIWANSRGYLVCCSPWGCRVRNPSSSNLWTLLPVLNHVGFAPFLTEYCL